MPPPEHHAKERRILHFTHFRHIGGMIDDDALYADSHVGTRLQVEIGDRSIKAYRRIYPVTCGPGGHPCDYVPFYFAPRSPMLYKIGIGGVPHYQDGQDPLVYLVGTIGDVVRAGLRCVFSNGNCGARLTEYYDDLRLLDSEVDWPLMRARMWKDTAEDPTRATPCAAEFLVHERMPWSLIRGLVTRTEATADMVRGLLSDKGQTLQVVVRPDWYYDGERFR